MPDLSDSVPIHPHRGRVLSELHARPFAAVQAPARVIRLGFTTQADRLAEATAALAQRCERSGLPVPPIDARHIKVDFPEGCFQLERHNEFVTYTWISPAGDVPFVPPPTAHPGAGWLPAPGLLIVAVDVHVMTSKSAPDPAILFPTSGAAIVDVDGARAVIATDFRADAHGYVRIMIADRSSDSAATALLVQSLLEIETYRSLALLGLPEALACGTEVERIEKVLPEIMRDVQGARSVVDNRALLERITLLSAEVETLAATSSFRFGATRAYARLIAERIARMKENPHQGASSLEIFLGRRFDPAVRTCDAVEARLSALSVKIGRAVDLLRTRVEVDMEAQNSQLLHQMSDQIRLQIRLQQAVEWLSVAAITYYVASVTVLVLEPLEQAGWHVTPQIAAAAMVPVAAGGMFWLLWRAKRPHA